MNGTPLGREESTVEISPAPRRRVSWGAIWGGMFVTVVLQIMFTLLGIACGIPSLNPLRSAETAPAGLSMGAAIWLMVSWLVAMWIGACVAGWMSGGPRRADGLVHGVVAWSFSAIVIVLLMSTAAGAFLTGSGRLLGGRPGYGGGPALFGQQQQTLAPTGRTSETAQAAPTDQGEEGAAAAATSSGSTPGAQQIWGGALWSFIALALGLAVAAWGGATGVAEADRVIITRPA